MSEAINLDQESRIEKIQKLLNKAQGASTEDEAAAFFAKAEELMQRYAIDDAMLRARGDMVEDTLEDRKVKIPSTYFAADIQLLLGIAVANDCRVLQNKGGGYAYVLGYSSDIDSVLLLFQLLQVQSARFAREALRDEPTFGYTKMDEYVWRRSFRFGFAQRVSGRLHEQKERTKVEATKTHGSGMELVLVSKKDKVEDFYNGRAGGKARDGNMRGDFAGKAAGRAAGDRADIGNKRVGGRKALGK